MTEEKKTEEKKNTKIKATTGAWWKSTVIEVEKEQDSTPVSATPTPAEEQDDSSPKSPAKPAARRKRTPRKSSPVKSKTTAEEPDEQAAEKPVSQKKKPAPARRSKRVKPAVTTDSAVSDENAQEVEKQQKGSETPSSPKKTTGRSPRKSSSTRGRRKPADSPADTSGSAVKGETPVGESAEILPAESPTTENDESSTGAAIAQPRKKPAGRKPRSRKKPASPKKDNVDSSETSGADNKQSQDESAKDQGEPETQPTENAGELPDETDTDVKGTGAQKDKVVLKLLINAEEPEECRLALLENGRLESIHVSTINRTLTKNNIYKGRIVAIEPNLQAAFVDYGTEKNGFLPFSEIHPEYYKQELSATIQKLVDEHQWKKLSITDVVEKGQDVLVQVVKEEVGRKGANMTTYLSLPGRSVVLMPGSDSSGISRKISGEERRSQLRTAMSAQNIPEGIGWIVRTASADITKTALARDVGYLLSLWEEIKKKAQELEGIGQVYEDHQSVLRFLRENFDPDIEEILVDADEARDQVNKFISLLPSKHRNVKVRLHKGARPIFNQYSVEDQIESIYQPHVNLPSGGSIVIDPTEALVAIDVNSGSTSKGKNFEQSIYQANMEAASELARQLRLRDLGGLIVVDFIDMRNKKHIRDVEREVKVAMKRDKAKVDFSRISKFGLMQISRQKLGAPIEAGNYRVCKHCKGRGIVRSVETLALFYLRRIQTGASRKHVERVECRFPMDVAQYLLNQKRHEIQEHESRYNTEITIIPDTTMSPVDNEILLLKKEKETTGKKQA
ncbi:Rne/Rng family ribonuclease [Desulfopila sp. IMCC35008]|uniref:Rne/Rng family ribonuclease n=1 Tax=Desulfopila sp. IMCC35008 TaxID=2653858 RepID=UPI0013D131F6|nr:Rne/Rng family ribonuclease [Desulfopila sp. IMCC35008]